MCCYVDQRLCVVVSFYFGHGVFCPSIFDVLNAPLVCSTLSFCLTEDDNNNIMECVNIGALTK
jgi:hypothetical protein